MTVVSAVRPQKYCHGCKRSKPTDTFYPSVHRHCAQCEDLRIVRAAEIKRKTA